MGEGEMHAAGFQTDYRYTGKELDKEIGLHYYGQRYYEAGTGRFTQQDPRIFNDIMGILANPQGLNAYAYTENNPVRYIDPNGETRTEAAGGYFVGLAAGLWSTMNFGSNLFWHPVETSRQIAQSAAAAGKEWQELTADLVNNTNETLNEISNGSIIAYNEFQDKSDYEKGKVIGQVTEKVMEGAVVGKALGKVLGGNAAASNSGTINFSEIPKASELRAWAKNQGYETLRYDSSIEVWGIKSNSEWMLKIKQPAKVPGIDPGSIKPRFSARNEAGQYINPVTGQAGTRREFGHLDVDIDTLF